jgi:hypothetical protein
MDAQSTKVSGEVVNYFPIVLIGGVLLFILGATLFCCFTGTGPKHRGKDEDLFDEIEGTEGTLEKSRGEKSKPQGGKKKKSGKKGNLTESQLDASLAQLSRSYIYENLQTQLIDFLFSQICRK